MRDVSVDGRTAIPAGTRALGAVTMVERGGKVKERARLGVRFHTLVLADGAQLPIRTDTIIREGESPAGDSARKIGGAAVGGAILGALMGGKKGAIVGSTAGAAGGTAVVMAGDRNAATLPAGRGRDGSPVVAGVRWKWRRSSRGSGLGARTTLLAATGRSRLFAWGWGPTRGRGWGSRPTGNADTSFGSARARCDSPRVRVPSPRAPIQSPDVFARLATWIRRPSAGRPTGSPTGSPTTSRPRTVSGARAGAARRHPRRAPAIGARARRIVRTHLRGLRADHPPRHHSLESSRLLRLLRHLRQRARRARRVPVGRAQRPGDAVADVAGRHRARGSVARVAAAAARPARRVRRGHLRHGLDLDAARARRGA